MFVSTKHVDILELGLERRAERMGGREGGNLLHYRVLARPNKGSADFAMLA